MRQSPPVRHAEMLGLDVEIRTIRNHGWRFPAHWHEDLQAIATVYGHGEITVPSGRYSLPPGGLVIIPPGLVHTARSAGPAEWTFRSLHASPKRLNPPESYRVSLTFANSGDRLSLLFRDVTNSLLQRTQRHKAVEKFELFLAAVATRIEPVKSATALESVLAVACAKLATDLQGTMSIADFAECQGWSVGYFSRAFRKAFGMSPHAWRLNARTEAAKRALRAGAGVADAAAVAGFSNLSHFSRHYRTRTGITARAYARRIAGMTLSNK